MHVKSSLVVVKQRQKKVSSLHHPLSDPAVSGVCQNIRMSVNGQTVLNAHAREVCACVRADASPTHASHVTVAGDSACCEPHLILSFCCAEGRYSYWERNREPMSHYFTLMQRLLGTIRYSQTTRRIFWKSCWRHRTSLAPLA